MRLSDAASRASRTASPTATSAERRRAPVARLDRMSREERLRAARFEFDRIERTIWAGRFPEEVPTVNDEVEWIALRLADLD